MGVTGLVFWVKNTKKPKLRVFLTGYTVTMITRDVTKIIKICLSIIGHLFDTISVLVSDKYLWHWPIKVYKNRNVLNTVLSLPVNRYFFLVFRFSWWSFWSRKFVGTDSVQDYMFSFILQAPAKLFCQHPVGAQNDKIKIVSCFLKKKFNDS